MGLQLVMRGESFLVVTRGRIPVIKLFELLLASQKLFFQDLFFLLLNEFAAHDGSWWELMLLLFAGFGWV